MDCVVLGEVKLGERVVVCDPIYKPAPWCSVTVPVKAGTWTAQVRLVDRGLLGKGVFSLFLGRNKELWVSCLKAIGTVLSDSAMVGVWDSVRYNSAFADSKGKFLENVSALMFSDARAGIYDGVGAVAYAVDGKGRYPVFAGKNKNGEIVYLSIQVGIFA